MGDFNGSGYADQTDWIIEAEALARTLYHLGIHAGAGPPDGTNAAAWATSITS